MQNPKKIEVQQEELLEQEQIQPQYGCQEQEIMQAQYEVQQQEEINPFPLRENAGSLRAAGVFLR